MSLLNSVPALRAEQAIDPTVGAPDLSANEHHLDPLVEALLTNVVRRLRASWLAGPALLWGDIHPVRKVVTGEFDQRIAATLVDGFAQFSELLAGFEMLVLELQERGVVTEQRLLGLEKRIVKRGHFFGDEVEVSDAGQGLGDVPGRTQCGRNDSDL